MQFLGIKIFYKSIEDKLIKVFSFHGENRKGKSMTRVGKVDAVAAQEVKQKKKNEETKKSDTQLQELLGNKDAQKTRREELIDDYLGLGLTKRQAKKAAKNQVKNEVSQERVDKTVVYLTKEEYKKHKDEDIKNGLEPEYIKNKKVRGMIEKNPERFYETDDKGNKVFSSDKYKIAIREYTGLDYKLNLDERKAGAEELGIKKKGFFNKLINNTDVNMKRAAKYANFEVERDNTNLYRAGVIASSTALGTLTGGALAGTFTSNVTGIHIDGQKELLGHQESNATAVNAARGGVVGLVTGIALAAFVKDRGYADVFQGISVEEIIKQGSTGIKGEANKKIVDSILNLEHLPDDLKAQAMKVAYGQATGKKVNERELIAAYELAKAADEEYSKIPPVDTPPVDTPPVDTPPEDNPPVDTPPEEQCSYEVCKEEGAEPKSYEIKAGNYPSGIIEDLYEVKYGTPEYNQIRDEVYKASGYKRNTNLKVGDKFTLPDVKIGDKTYAANMDNKDKVRTGNIADNGLTLGRTNRVVKSGDKYYIQNCKGDIKMDEAINGSTDMAAVQARVDALNAELEAQRNKK